MGVFEMIVLIVLIATIGKVVDSAVSRTRHRGEALPTRRVEELEAKLQANEARLNETEARMMELGDKLEFVERLLTPPETRGRISGSGKEE